MSSTQAAVISGDPTAACSRSSLRVRFGETDLMGIVHHATYLSYFEAGRVEYLRRRGVEYLAWAARGVNLPVVEANLRYRRAARFDDLLVVETRLGELGRVKVRFDYRVLRAGEQGEELLCEGFTLLACVNEALVPRRLPPDVAELLRGPETAPHAV